MMEETTFGAESSRWPETRQNWAITTPPAAGAHTVNPSAPPKFVAAWRIRATNVAQRRTSEASLRLRTAPRERLKPTGSSTEAILSSVTRSSSARANRGNSVKRPFGGWPPLNSTCLPGLESLTHLDVVFIDQRKDMLEAVVGWPQKNKYVVMEASGQPLFYLKEESSAFSRLCCGSSREFNIRVYDRTNREVLRMHRPTELWMSKLEVFSGNMRIGSINEKCAMLYPEYDIINEYGNTVFQISGPCCICDCFGPTQFKVFSADASREIGVITKDWSGLMREMFTNADVFGVSFPTSLDVKMKALLISSAILIDFEHFETH